MKYDPNKYIEDTIIAHLQRFTDGDAEARDIPWDSMRMSLSHCARLGISYMTVLHRLMRPYYEMFFYGENDLCRVGPLGGYTFMNAVMSADGEFPVWASSLDLICSAEGWGSYAKRMNRDDAYHYICALEHLVSDSCCIDWQALAEQLKAELFKAEAYSDYKTDELLCIIHALSMMMQQSWTIVKKRKTFELLRDHWGFMKHVYSMMTRHIVGSRLQNFAALANVVMSTNANLPHLEIFYCALTERMDSLGLDEKKFRKLDDARQKMLSRINATKSSEILYELCDTLFPEEFQLMLRHKPKSYREVEDESMQKDELIRQVREQNKHLTSDLERTKNVLQQMILSSIPIEEIDAELMKYPPATAFDLLRELNNSLVLSVMKAWREHYPALVDKYRKRLFEPIDQQRDLTDAMMKVAERPTTSYNYASGATHNDNRNQLALGEEKDKVIRLKRLANE